MRVEVDLSDLPPIRAYGMYTPEPVVKRGIPKGVYWLGALVLSFCLWAGVVWLLYSIMRGAL